MRLPLSIGLPLASALVASATSHVGAVDGNGQKQRALPESAVEGAPVTPVPVPVPPPPVQESAVSAVPQSAMPSVQVFLPGTLVYMEFDDCQCWYMGKIASADGSTYTVDWDDGSEEVYTYTDLAKVTTMVTQAAEFIADASALSEVKSNAQVYPAGTPVYYRFDTGWYAGTITAYDASSETYTVTWSDETADENYYSDLRQVLIMVEQAASEVIYGGDIPGLTFDVGSSVYFEFPDDWYQGTITSFNSCANKPPDCEESYTVTWEDDDVRTYKDMMRMKQMVDQASLFDVDGLFTPKQVFPIGTPIYENFPDDGGWYSGTISKYSKGRYTVTWSDNTNDKYDDIRDVLRMVTQAYNTHRDDSQFFLPGTMVLYHFDDGWYAGRINGHSEGNYKVAWSDFTGYYYHDPEQVLQMVVQAAEVVLGEAIDLYPTGTPVYYQFPDMWYTGEITKFDKGTYTITWSDKSKTTYTDPKVIKQMVDQAINLAKMTPPPTPAPVQEFAIGTEVYKEFDDAWYEGKITGFDKGEYEVTYSDETVFYYDDAEEVRQMVNDFKDKPVQYIQKFATGTKVYKKFSDGWFEGKITDYDKGEYEVTYSDETVYYYDDEDDVRQMVHDYDKMPSKTPEFSVGTPVYKKFKDGWYDGFISAYDPSKGEYEVTYSDNTVYYYGDIEEVRKMVWEAEDQGIAGAQSASNGGGGAGAAGAALIAIAAIVAVVAAFFFFRKKRDQKEDVIPAVNTAPTLESMANEEMAQEMKPSDEEGEISHHDELKPADADIL